MSAVPRRDRGGLVFATGFAGLALWALWETREMTPLGAVFPRTFASALLLLALLYIIRQWLKPGAAGSRPPGGSWVRRGLLVLLLAGWILALPRLGFVVASLAAFLLLSLVAAFESWRPSRWLLHLLVAGLTVAGFHYLFAELLRVPLPEARWF
ncbi:MAG: tripartite tricarboxylate transporter TctB family protein [Candidatus Competibacterales bacterium]|nr:tripartite tricarboxylate transporter TctB family protein [Candidatus Competibacterales bacterium]